MAAGRPEAMQQQGGEAGLKSAPPLRTPPPPPGPPLRSRRPWPAPPRRAPGRPAVGGRLAAEELDSEGAQRRGWLVMDCSGWPARHGAAAQRRHTASRRQLAAHCCVAPVRRRCPQAPCSHPAPPPPGPLGAPLGARPARLRVGAGRCRASGAQGSREEAGSGLEAGGGRLAAGRLGKHRQRALRRARRLCALAGSPQPRRV